MQVDTVRPPPANFLTCCLVLRAQSPTSIILFLFLKYETAFRWLWVVSETTVSLLLAIPPMLPR